MEEQGGITRRKMIRRLGVTGVVVLGGFDRIRRARKTGTYDNSEIGRS
jgi:hypothetical protein